MMINKCKKQFEINRIGNTNCWIKNGFQHRGLINHFLAKRFINPGGPPVLKLHFFWQRGLINTDGFINPNLTLSDIRMSCKMCNLLKDALGKCFLKCTALSCNKHYYGHSCMLLYKLCEERS